MCNVGLHRAGHSTAGEQERHRLPKTTGDALDSSVSTCESIKLTSLPEINAWELGKGAACSATKLVPE